MHFEILVEGQGELTALSIIMNQIVGDYRKPHTWSIHKHPGIGKLPENLKDRPNPEDKSLLHNLPSKLRAYSKCMSDDECVVLLVDLDDKPDCRAFKKSLYEPITFCTSPLNYLIRIAIEELEAWFLGDINAIAQAYPDYNREKYNEYIQDSQYGTWEMLADIIHPGGYTSLSKSGKRSRIILEQKCKWAKNISRYMNVDDNRSHSFCCFRDGLRKLAGIL